jgi:CheY-like chemotaxis protein
MLRKVVRDEPGAAVAGEAKSGAEATTLARELRPDVALLDFHLPRAIGLDSVRLSRINGLDAAQTINAEVPGTRVVLLTDLDTDVVPRKGTGRKGIATSLSTGSNRSQASPTLRELCYEVAQPSPLVFANIRAGARKRVSKRTSMATLLSGMLLSVVGAWMLAGVVLSVLLLVAILVQ